MSYCIHFVVKCSRWRPVDVSLWCTGLWNYQRTSNEILDVLSIGKSIRDWEVYPSVVHLTTFAQPTRCGRLEIRSAPINCGLLYNQFFFLVYIVSNVSKATHINMSNSYRHWDGTTPMTSLYFITVLNLLYGISTNTSMLDDVCVCKRYICISANMIIQSDNIFTIYMYRFP